MKSAPGKKKKCPYLMVALLTLGMVWWIMGRESVETIPVFADETAARDFLRSQVADGSMSKMEAQLRLAEAIASIQKRQRKEHWRKAYAEKIEEIMEEKDVTADEASRILEDFKKGKKGSGKAKSNGGKKGQEGLSNAK